MSVDVCVQRDLPMRPGRLLLQLDDGHLATFDERWLTGLDERGIDGRVVGRGGTGA